MFVSEKRGNCFAGNVLENIVKFNSNKKNRLAEIISKAIILEFYAVAYAPIGYTETLRRYLSLRSNFTAPSTKAKIV